MANYIKSVGEFLADDSDYIIEEIKKNNPESESSQIQSWKALITDLKNSNISNLDKSITISLEYSLPLDGMGIDVLFAGLDKFNQKKVIIVEAKQWVDSNVFTYEFGEYRSETLTLHPQIQVSRHAAAFKDYLSIGENYEVRPLIFAKNLTISGIRRLLETNPSKTTTNVPIEVKINKIIEIVSNEIMSSNNDINNELKTAEYKPSKSIISAMSSMVSRYDPFILTKEQEEVVTTVLKELDSGKKVIRITGAAGSGKTAILLHLYIKLLNESNDDKRPIFISGAQNTKLYQSLFPEVERSFTFSFSLNRMVGRTIGHKYFICMDEAQHNEQGIITEMINRGAHLILCYDEAQTINANNALTELESLDNRKDFVSINLKNSVRYSGSQVFETNVKKVLNGEKNLLADDKFDFRVFDSIDELEKHTIDLIKQKPNSTVAITGLLSNDAKDISERPGSHIFLNWGYQGESRWIPYIEGKNYLDQYNGKLWVGTWWLPGLDVDYISVIVGNDARMTINGLKACPEGAKHYKMMLSVAKELNFPSNLFVTKNSFGKIVEDTVKSTKNVLTYIEGNADIKKEFMQRFTELLKNNYYILLTRGRKGCFVCFSNK